MLLENRENDPAILYRNERTGKVDWVWARLWDSARNDRPLRLLKRTTATEAFNFKWLAQTPDDPEADYILHKANWENR